MTGYRDEQLALYVGDYDGDGLDDIGIAQCARPGRGTCVALDGQRVQRALVHRATLGGVRHPAEPTSNGDGGVDLVGSAVINNEVRYRLHNAAFPDFVDRITDGFDMYVDFDYVRLSNSGGVYTKGTGSSVPDDRL